MVLEKKYLGVQRDFCQNRTNNTFLTMYNILISYNLPNILERVVNYYAS